MSEAAAGPETYSNAGNAAYEGRILAARGLDDKAWLLPHLQPGLRVLDCGCGPGSITLAIAALIGTEGVAVGIDNQASSVDAARALASERSAGNVSFDAGDVYALDYPDASFDLVCGFSLLFHLKEQVRALREMRRVTRPGGVVVVSDIAMRGTLFEPEDAALERLQELQGLVISANGGDPQFGLHQAAALREAGFDRIETIGTLRTAADNAARGRIAAALDARTRGPNAWRTIVANGWATEPELEAMLSRLKAWAADDGSSFIQPFVNAVAWR